MSQIGKSLLFGFYAAVLLLMLAQLVAVLGPVSLGDMSIYAQYAHLMTSGHLPYSSGLRLEYPPGVVPFIWLAVPLGKLGGSYILGFVTLTLIVTGLFLGHRYYRGGQRALLLAGLLLLPLLQFVFYELDVFAALALYGAVYAVARCKYTWSAALLAVSTLIKAYPAVCLLGLIWVVPRERRRTYLAVFFGLVAAVLLPVAIGEPRGFWYAVMYHSGRPLEFQSSGAAIGFGLHLLGRPAHIIHTHASQALLFPGASLVGAASSLGLLLSLGWVWGMTLRQRLQPKPATLSLILLLLYIVWFKVGSPQYLVAALFVLPLASEELSRRLYAGLIKRFLGLGIAMWLLFIVLFNLGDTALGAGAWLVAVLSGGRIIILAELVVFLCRCLWQKPPAAGQKPPPRSGRRQPPVALRRPLRA